MTTLTCVDELIKDMRLDVADGVLPPWPSARAIVAALLERPAWRDGIESIIDMGCGSGILGIAAARLVGGAFCTFVDIYPGAVELSCLNAARNSIEGISLVSDVWDDVDGRADLVICNPPFQSEGDGGRSLVDPKFRMHRRLLSGAASHLTARGRLLMGTSPAVTGSSRPEELTAESGWTVEDACTISVPAPSSRDPDRVHDYRILLLRPAPGRIHS